MKKALLLCMVAMCSCVDRDYDLDKADTDDISVGQSITGPLGTGTILLSDLINTDQIAELQPDAQGNYVIRYEDFFTIEPETTPEITDKTYSVPPISMASLFSTSGSLPTDLPATQLGSNSVALVFDKNDALGTISEVNLNTAGTNSQLQLDMKLSGITFTSATGKLNFEVEFPAGYELAAAPSSPLPSGVSLSAKSTPATVQKLSGAFALQGLNTTKTIVLKIKKIVSPTAVDNIKFTAGIAELKSGNTVTISGTPQVQLSGEIDNLAYDAIYATFNTEMAISEKDLTLDGLGDIFEGADNRLSFTGMYITLDTETNIGIPNTVTLRLTASGGSQTVAPVEIANIPIAAPTTLGGDGTGKVLIGTPNSPVPGYTQVPGSAGVNLGSLLEYAPTKIVFSGAGSVAARPEPMFYPATPSTRVSYSIVAPLTPSADFRANVSETIDDAFDKDMIDVLFKEGSGSLELLGTVQNSLPLKLDMRMVIVDQGGAPVGITMPVNTVAPAATSQISFTITAEDMDKMQNARHIKFEIAASGDPSAQNIALRPDQRITLALRFRKTGGINI